MPIYEYECTECGGVIEAVQKFNDEPLVECSKCKGRLKKIISQSAFHLKGGGWYVDEYGSKSASKTAASKPSGTKTSSASD
jgi:putative FmdB family regulatory protein